LRRLFVCWIFRLIEVRGFDKMIKPDMLEKMFSGAVIGCIAGGSYGLFRGFLAQPGYAERLKPRPECFDMDSGAAKLFFELSKYRYYDENSFVEALRNFDSLFCLEKQLILKEVEPQIIDPPTAIQYGVRAFTHLRKMVGEIKEEAIYDEVRSLIKQLEKIAEDHVHQIDLLCRHVDS
jgi:hypothetical protein